MCLDTVTKRYLIPRRKELTAYKQFTVGDDGTTLHSHMRTLTNTWTPGEWLKARGFSDNHGWFRTGFYCYVITPNPFFSSSFAPIVPIRIRGVVTIGKLSGNDVLIAREMFIPVNWRELAIHEPSATPQSMKSLRL